VEREATLLVVSLAVCGPLCAIFGTIAPTISQLPRSGRGAETLAWRRLWMPLVPAGFALVTLLGWAAQEADDTDDAIDPMLLVLALPGAVIGARAIARALTSVVRRETPLAATIGLVRPRVIIDPKLAALLDADALAAAIAHEQAHARHRDPLQIWLAQFAADLQWPGRSASDRFRQWLHALEVARDEEARESGTNGEALASAIVTTAQFAQRQPRACARLLGHGEMLRDRIARLLRPVVGVDASRGVVWIVAILAVAACGLTLGIVGGDHLLRALPGVS
jgi:hypothetical protein